MIAVQGAVAAAVVAVAAEAAAVRLKEAQTSICHIDRWFSQMPSTHPKLCARPRHVQTLGASAGKHPRRNHLHARYG